MKIKKRALVLSGGGFKGAFQIGALQYIQASWHKLYGTATPMHFDIVAGVSVGAINGALVASRQLPGLERMWDLIKANGGKEIYESDFIDNGGKIQLGFDQLKKKLLPAFNINAGLIIKGVWNSIRRIFDKKVPGFVGTLLTEAEKEFNENFPLFKSLANNLPLEKKLKQLLDLSKIPTSTVFQCGLVSIDGGQYYSLENADFKNNEAFVQAVLASSATPIIWEPVPVVPTVPFPAITNAVDGGIRNISPLGDVISLIDKDTDDAEYEVVVINCNSGYIAPMSIQWNIGDIALRTLTEITLAEIFNNDIEEFLKINELVTQAAANGVVLRYKGRALHRFNYTLIQPEADELGKTLDSSAEMLTKREQLGYAAAMKAFGTTTR